MKNRLLAFFLRPASALPIAALRIGLAILLLVQAYFLKDALLPLFSRLGFIQGPLSDALLHPGVPLVSWLSDRLAPWGLSETACLYGISSFYVLGLILLCLGLYTRVASIAVWLLHWVLMNTGYTSAYGVDLYAHVFLFYLMFVPAGRALSLDQYFRGRSQWHDVSWQARLGMRVMQLHLCISYFWSAVEKSGGEQWWNGEIAWRTMTLPMFAQFNMTWIANFPLILKFGGWATLVFEGLYFIFIWPRMTRKLWIAGIFGLHFSIALFMGLHLFGAIMCLLTLTLFGVRSEPAAFPAVLSPNSASTRESAPLSHDGALV